MQDKKLNVNRPPLTPEEIGGYKNFDALQQRYQSAQRFRYIKWGGAGLAAAAVALIVVLSVWRTPDGAEKIVVQPFINPPLESVDVAYTSYSVDAAQGAELNYETGSTIKIPQNAFLDKNGNVVTGKVDVRYREFHNPVDFFISGIPMSYDSGGVQYEFESAGMVEIVAYQNNEPLLVNPNSKIDISMLSAQTEDKYNLYFLDTVQRNWVNKGRDKILPQEQTEGDTAAVATLQPERKKIESDAELKALASRMLTIQNDIREKEDEKPLEPRKAKVDGYIFDFDVSPREFPEIALFDGMYFQIGEENKNFDPALYKSTWDDAALSENKKGVNYLLRLKKGAETYEFIVYPVYKGDNYNTAMKMYEQKYKAYQDELVRRKEAEKKAKEEYEGRVKKLAEERQAQLKAWEEQQKAMIAVASSTQKIYRTFSVSNFGIWNCDQPVRREWGQPVFANFTDKKGTGLKLAYAYVADKSRNMLITWYPHQFNQFRFNPGSNQVIFGITYEDKLAVIQDADFKALKKGETDYDFPMTVSDKNFTTVEEVKNYLGI